MKINGKDYDFKQKTIDEVLQKLDIDSEKIVFELNEKIISKDKYKEIILNKEDKIEIIAFVGGG
ncbi:MAG: sulfur carrier protein ThiS [Bacillota bacterium]